MTPRKSEVSTKRVTNKGAWTAEEDRKLEEYIEIHGPKKWKTVALKSGLNRCGKSCRLRWLNYLRPNIKRGNISAEEEDLILRLHKLLGNRWSLIAGRIPGRTDNEIKNYWNSHLCKKINQKDQKVSSPLEDATRVVNLDVTHRDQVVEQESVKLTENPSEMSFDVDELFDFSSEGCFGLDWVNKFLELDEDPFLTHHHI